MRTRRALVTATVTGVVVFAAGCGGGSENAAEPLPAPPKLTVPGEEKTPTVTPRSDSETETTETTTETAVTPTQTETAPAQSTDPSTAQGGAAAPQTGGATPDSEQNDQAPAQDSPASKFEQFCEDNPGAC